MREDVKTREEESIFVYMTTMEEERLTKVKDSLEDRGQGQ